ncbi:hypothetical protein EJ110_NYTH27383 [Nymphaea thermarum]|nr:hypothetical protein EJ110_NYTH27383 [Nymphaea thermarum]
MEMISIRIPEDGVSVEVGGWVKPEAELLLPVALPLRVDVGVKGVRQLQPTHDEIDMEFLGNETGQPYTLHTNVYTQGKGNREQQFRLWFYVDGTLIRMFRNHESSGVAYPSRHAIRMYSNLWDAEDWATQGGRVKTDWSKVPFVATFGDVAINGCVWKGSASSCDASSSGWMNQAAAASDLQKMQWVQRNYMIYNYCKDVSRFPQGLPAERSLA